jgi:hypothetical protein
MAQERSLIRKFQPTFAAAPNFEDHLDNVVNVRLGVNAARDSEPQEVHRTGVLDALVIALAEH